jgi:hypothetical protein
MIWCDGTPKRWFTKLWGTPGAVDRRGGQVGATVHTEDLAGLRHLAKLAGDRFVAGHVLYTGQQTLPYGQRIRAVPMDALWQTRALGEVEVEVAGKAASAAVTWKPSSCPASRGSTRRTPSSAWRSADPREPGGLTGSPAGSTPCRALAKAATSRARAHYRNRACRPMTDRPHGRVWRLSRGSALRSPGASPGRPHNVLCSGPHGALLCLGRLCGRRRKLVALGPGD